MGLYDSLYFTIEFIDKVEEYFAKEIEIKVDISTEFQTKDLDCMMQNFCIEKDGSIVQYPLPTSYWLGTGTGRKKYENLSTIIDVIFEAKNIITNEMLFHRLFFEIKDGKLVKIIGPRAGTDFIINIELTINNYTNDILDVFNNIKNE